MGGGGGNRIKMMKECGQMKCANEGIFCQVYRQLQCVYGIHRIYRIYYTYFIPYVVYRVKRKKSNVRSVESFFAKGF